MQDIRTRIIQAKRDEIDQYKEAINRLFTEVITREMHDVKIKQQLLESLDPRTILHRGYAVVRKSGKRLISKKGLKIGDGLEVILADGTIYSTVERV